MGALTVTIITVLAATFGTLALAFRNSGFTTVAADSGEQAIATLARDAPDPRLLVVDYDLPGGLTGLEVVERLREQAGLSIPVIIHTGDISTASSGAIRGW